MSVFTALVWLAGAFGLGLFIGFAWRPARAPQSRKDSRS